MMAVRRHWVSLSEWMSKNWPAAVLAVVVALANVIGAFVIANGVVSVSAEHPDVNVTWSQEGAICRINVENHGPVSDNSVYVRADFSAPIANVRILGRMTLRSGGQGNDSALFFMPEVIGTETIEITIISTAEWVSTNVTAHSAVGTIKVTRK